MPEIELRKDPLGANRGKSFREQAGIVSTRAKKHMHDKYYIPPYRPTNRNWEMTFASLGYDRRIIEKFWKLFCRICHSSGAIKLEHFLRHFGLDWTPWTELAFKHFDTTGGGDIDFLEFMISVWNVCTFKIDSISNFTFDMYDLDCDGELSIPEIERMIKELFGEGGGKECMKQAIEFAEARGGALNLNSFIAFTGSHQLLLFPMFQIQRKIQRKVFGLRFWEKMELSAKDNFNDQNKNDFNPRHVQILLRTYQTGGAAAVLSHTGDPNKGLRDWYENQKPQEEEQAGVENEEAPGLARWDSLREKVNSKAKATRQWSSAKKVEDAIKQNTLGIMKEFKPRTSRLNRKNVNKVDGASASDSDAVGLNVNENSSTNGQGSATCPPINVAADLQRIRARRTEKSSQDRQRQNLYTNRNGNRTPAERPASSNLPANVADDLKRIRARRVNAAESVQTNNAPRPGSAAEESHRIRKANKAKRKDVPPSSRTKSIALTQNNTRRREAGSMFFKSGASSKGWLQ